MCTCADHCDAYRNAFTSTWPASKFGTCWPHIARKFGEGREYMKKNDPNFEAAEEHIRGIHYAKTAEMKDLFIQEAGKIWDRWSDNNRKFWNSYCTSGWDCWSLGDFSCIPLCTPSQQAHESWHKQVLTSKIPGMFKGSTEHVISVAFPQLLTVDGLYLPDELLMSVPYIPMKMLEKAVVYVDQRMTRVRAEKVDGVFKFYILSASSTYGIFLQYS